MSEAQGKTTEAVHTPGPWTIWGEDDLRNHQIDDLTVVACQVGPSDEEDDIFICNIGDVIQLVHPVNIEDSISLANARLIAASPDLLAALKALLENYQALSDCGDCGQLEIELSPQGKAAYAAIAKAEGKP